MKAESETVMASVNEQCEQRKENFRCLHGAAERLEVEGVHKSSFHFKQRKFLWCLLF